MVRRRMRLSGRRRWRRLGWGWRVIALAVVFGLLVAGTAGGLIWWDKARTEAERAEALGPMIERIAGEYGLDPALVRAVIDAESSFDPKAVSDKGARGLMQIMPIAQREVMRRHGLPDGDLFDPEYNLTLGCAYLRQLLTRFDGDLHLSLAAYHMGPTRTARLRRKHPGLNGPQLVEEHAYRSTQAYVAAVLANYRQSHPDAAGR